MNCLQVCEYWLRDHMDNKIAWSFIDANEGSSKQGYVPCDKKGDVIGESGCTIASGFDVGQQSVSSMVAYHFTPDLLKQLLPYVEKKSAVAKDFLAKYPLTLSDEEVEEINDKVHKKCQDDLCRLYNANSTAKFEDLDSKKATAIMSVFYQYGNLKLRCPNFFKAIVNGWWKEAVDELRSFGDKYPTRRNAEADLLESSL